MNQPLPTPVGGAPAFMALVGQISRAAPLNRPTLVIGERGTGKELVAARLHYLSPRWQQPFVKLNCAALSETLLETELFGYEPGAFTGATKRHQGRFEIADGGTLFLDEIATASLRVQEKILRVVEYGEFERVGGTETLSVEVRVVGATNADLPGMAAAGTFRADLLDRLAFDVLTVPPLRAREGDVTLLAEHFGVAMAQELGLDFFPGFTPDALDRMNAYSWPGNVRELKNVVERAVYRADPPDRPIDIVQFDPFESPWRPTAHHLHLTTPASTPLAEEPPRAARPQARRAFLLQVAEYERTLLANSLKEHRFNRKRAAAALGLTYDQLRGYLRKHRLLEGEGE